MPQSSHRISRSTVGQRGFTLIELLIVMVIIGLLAGLVAPNMFGKVDKAKVSTAKAQLDHLSTAVETFRLDVGRFPNDLDELMNSSAEGWDGPYFPKSVPKDPWGNEFVIEAPAEDVPYQIYSLGRDGEQGGEELDADIYLFE
jgi:general secretion pathway protein G